MKAKLICIAIGLGGLMVGAVGIFCTVGLVLYALDEYTSVQLPEWLEWYGLNYLPALAFACGAVVGWCLFRWCRRRKAIVWEFGPRMRITAWVVLVLYLLTWALGGPMVQNENTRWAVNRWKRVCEDPDRGGLHSEFPSIRTSVTVPLVPFVVVSYHEYKIWRLAGAGGWDIQLWYVTGVKRLGFLATWRS